MRQFFRGQMATEQYRIQLSRKSEQLPLRIQAYERLILFCERISIPNALLRLNSEEMDQVHLKNALLIAIQKEYEHNLTQQIYVSGPLWEMITLLKDQTIATITQSYIDTEKDGKERFEIKLSGAGNTIDQSMTAKVREAIRKEVSLKI